MSERVVNLDNAPRPVVTLQVAGESFTIRRVVTGVRQLWAAFVKETTGLLEDVDAYNKARREQAGKKADIEAEARLDKKLSELAARMDGLNDPQRLLSILELLLVKNGYPFDPAWWIDNAGPEDYKDFVIAALGKDTDGSKKNTGAGE